jgi:hypothetical protein
VSQLFSSAARPSDGGFSDNAMRRTSIGGYPRTPISRYQGPQKWGQERAFTRARISARSPAQLGWRIAAL